MFRIALIFDNQDFTLKDLIRCLMFAELDWNSLTVWIRLTLWQVWYLEFNNNDIATSKLVFTWSVLEIIEIGTTEEKEVTRRST